MKKLALITDGLFVTAKPLNAYIEHDWVSTVVASRPTFYITHQVASFLYKGKQKKKKSLKLHVPQKMQKY